MWIIIILTKFEKVDVVKHLIEKVNLERKNDFGWTALHQAVFHANNRVIQILLASGASLEGSTFLGASVVDLAVASGNLETLK